MPVWAPMFVRSSAQVMNTTGNAGRKWVEKCQFNVKNVHTPGAPQSPRYSIQPKLSDFRGAL